MLHSASRQESELLWHVIPELRLELLQLAGLLLCRFPVVQSEEIGQVLPVGEHCLLR